MPHTISSLSWPDALRAYVLAHIWHDIAFRSDVAVDSLSELEGLLLDFVKIDNFELALELIEASPALATKQLDSHGYTTLHYASKHGNLDAIQKILGLCDMSDIETVFKHPPTPADVARESGHLDLEIFLKAIFPAFTEGEEPTQQNQSNDKHQSPQEKSPSPLPDVDEEFDITGLASNGGGSSGGNGSEVGGGLEGLLANLHGLLGALQGTVREGDGEPPSLSDMANLASQFRLFRII